MKKLYFIVILLIVAPQIFAQSWEQFIPFETRKAIDNKTRTLEGVPGENYWQNHSDYTITAGIDTENSILSGKETIVYYNESPDTLKYLFFRMYQNYYKKGTGRAWTIDTSDVTDGIKYDNIIVKLDGSDENIFRKASETPTNMSVSLKKPVPPHSKVVVEMEWSFRIPKISRNRMGNYGKNNFFIAYWYPQIAVYDDIDGWDRVEFYGTTEFYNDFNNYDIKITVPEGFKVWAPGELKNEKELFTKKVLKNIEKARESEEVVTIFTVKDCEKEKVLNNNKSENTWHFTASNIPDFTFGVEKNVNWDASSVVVDKETGRKTFVSAVYPDSLKYFDKVAKYSAWSIKFMSEVFPGVPFPFPKETVWSNGTQRGGMESPMMANNGDASKPDWTAGLSFHEIFHSYFPFYMGTNERKYAWMDEGWANYATKFSFDSLFPDYKYIERVVSTFEHLNGHEKEVPLSILSYQITDWQAYREHAYNRPSVAYNYLRKTMGDSLFFKGFHFYMKNWNGKHPTPFDFFTAMEKGSGLNLEWYFKPWFLQKCYADLAIEEVKDNTVYVANKGGLPLPVDITVTFEDGSSKKVYKKADVWKNNNANIAVEFDNSKKIKSIELGNPEIPDIYKDNNKIEY